MRARPYRTLDCSPARILIVEDDDAMRRAMSAQMRCAGHDCVAVDSAERALAAWQGREFDLLIADLRLPGACGCDLIEWIMDAEFVPVIVVTGYLSEHAARLASVPNVLVLEKPVEPIRLLHAIRSSLLEERGDRANALGPS
jgi:DNA-binding NtrC family response regulator